MYATLKQAAIWAGKAKGLCWPEDRAKSIELVNTIRSEFYSLKSVQWTVPLCLPVRCFNRDCTGSCTGAKYWGFTVPPGYVNILNVWKASRPMTILGRFTVYPHDSEYYHEDGYVARDMGEGFVFEVDPPANKSFFLQFHARNPGDSGKKVTVRFIDTQNRERTEEVTLTGEWPATQREVVTVQPLGITLPDNLKGDVVARLNDGTVVATYRPWEVVPNFRRIALSGADVVVNSNSQVAAICERDNVPLYADEDIVETGNELVWKDAARWLFLHEKTNGDETDVRNESKFYGKFKMSLEEEARKRRGKGKRFSFNFRGMTNAQSALIGKRGGRAIGRVGRGPRR